MLYLLDTNVLSEPLRTVPNANVVARLRLHESELATAAPVWHELVFGAERLPPSRRRTLIEQYLSQLVGAMLPILPYDTVAAAWHAAERARLSAAGTPMPFVDGQIAAIARTNQLILVTANVGDFAGYSELRVEDWRS